MTSPRSLFRFVAALALGLVLPGLASARDAAPVAAPVAAKVSSGHPALWEINGKQGKLYLFGTFHALPVGLNWRSGLLEKAIKRSDRLVTEVVLADMKDPKSAADLGQLMAARGFTADEGDAAVRLLTPKQVALLEKTAQRQGLPAAVVPRMRPWFATLMLSQGIIAESGYVPALGAEQQIVQSFAAKPNKGLETLVQQISVFADMDPQTAIQAMQETLSDGDEFAAKLKQLSDAWSSGDDATIEFEMVTQSRSKFPKFHQALFSNRNAAWVPQLEAYLATKGTTFVAVGAGHFYGSGGLIDLLKQRGLSVKRLQ